MKPVKRTRNKKLLVIVSGGALALTGAYLPSALAQAETPSGTMSGGGGMSAPNNSPGSATAPGSSGAAPNGPRSGPYAPNNPMPGNGTMNS
ncbi:MAG: hypothetical protein ACREQX_15205 [Candidatus Binataceae bacterium]